MKTNHSLHARRFTNVLAITVLTMLAAAQSTICIGQVFPPPPGSPTAEQLPQGETTQLSGPKVQDPCDPAPTDEPLFTLTTDIQPRAVQNGQAVPVGQVMPDKDLPFNCAGAKPIQQRMMSVDLSCDTCYPGYCDLLSMARFCHKPLYFNDDCLERCGVEQCCCQPCRSAMCFYGGALLMPVRACCVCPCSCVPSGGCCP